MYHRFYLLFCSLLSTFAFAGHEYDFSMLNDRTIGTTCISRGERLFFLDYDCRVCSFVQDILSLYSQLNQEKVILREYPVATAESNFSANIFYTLQSMQAEEVSNKLLF